MCGCKRMASHLDEHRRQKHHFLWPGRARRGSGPQIRPRCRACRCASDSEPREADCGQSWRAPPPPPGLLAAILPPPPLPIATREGFHPKLLRRMSPSAGFHIPCVLREALECKPFEHRCHAGRPPSTAMDPPSVPTLRVPPSHDQPRGRPRYPEQRRTRHCGDAGRSLLRRGGPSERAASGGDERATPLKQRGKAGAQGGMRTRAKRMTPVAIRLATRLSPSCSRDLCADAAAC